MSRIIGMRTENKLKTTYLLQEIKLNTLIIMLLIAFKCLFRLNEKVGLNNFFTYTILIFTGIYLIVTSM